LRRCRKAPIGFSPHSHSLDRVHNIVFLREEGVAKICGPLNVLVQLIQCIRDSHESLYAGIPGLLLGGIDQCLSAEILVPLQPLACLHNLERICAGYQHLAQQRIRI
jgi:hypothetical protein